VQNRCPALRLASVELGAWTGQDFPPASARGRQTSEVVHYEPPPHAREGLAQPSEQALGSAR
jgi:hypothetical protein